MGYMVFTIPARTPIRFVTTSSKEETFLVSFMFGLSSRGSFTSPFGHNRTRASAYMRQKNASRNETHGKYGEVTLQRPRDAAKFDQIQHTIYNNDG